MNGFFSTLLLLAVISTFILLITSFVFLFKKKQNTKKFFKFTGIAFILSIIFLISAVATSDKTNQKKTKEKTQTVSTEGKKEDKQKETNNSNKTEMTQDKFVDYAKNIRGGVFIKDIKLNNNEAEITYHDSYTSYKSQKPDSNMTEDVYKDYFSTGYAIEKILVGEPARLLRQFPNLNDVKMTLPFEGKTYSINLDRKSLNEYLGFKIESLSPEDQSWQKKFNNPYVYNKTKRTAYFKKFVIVQ
ncbi:hypothetical protein M3215_06955 [Bacillus cytotoxicus]|uniref:Uncharacterized protein n=1 Tax=Bacillus cytotoxicus TaxID=580165 RepID=A0ACC6A3S5_9BACI|nr:hypothetical protein [Bacillus cytotoxicus]